MTAGTPNPGSCEARDLGCRCPVVDNHHGAGSGRRGHDGKPLFWIAETCPVHAEPPHVCPGCYAVGGERCAPGCIDAEIEEERRHAIEEGDYDREEADDV